MREITQEEINAKLEAHKLWLDTVSDQGEQAVFKDVLIKEKDFSNLDLHEVIFKNVKCENTDFCRTDLCCAVFKDTKFYAPKFRNAILKYAKFVSCHIVDGTYCNAILDNARFLRTNLFNVRFQYTKLTGTFFAGSTIENTRLNWVIPAYMSGQKVICVQVNTSRKNNLISYWADLGIWTTGCFQGTLEKLREAVAKTHKDNPFLRARYERAINYILEEDKADKEAGKEK